MQLTISHSSNANLSEYGLAPRGQLWIGDCELWQIRDHGTKFKLQDFSFDSVVLSNSFYGGLHNWARKGCSGIPPFCVLTGGPRGPGSLPAICRFFDYQQCLQAAADLRGNCVINVDYPGKITSAPGAAWSQPPRQR